MLYKNLGAANGLHNNRIEDRGFNDLTQQDFHIMDNRDCFMLCGGFTKFRPVEEADLKLFQEAIGGLEGVNYEPLIVATQVVAGTNYKFICNAEAVVLTPRPYLAEITIFQPLPSEKETKPIITDIHAVD